LQMMQHWPRAAFTFSGSTCTSDAAACDARDACGAVDNRQLDTHWHRRCTACVANQVGLEPVNGCTASAPL
jgi:hypothetical protein